MDLRLGPPELVREERKSDGTGVMGQSLSGCVCLWVVPGLKVMVLTFLAQDRRAVTADDDHAVEARLRVLYDGDVGVADVHVSTADLAGLSSR